MTYCYFVRLCWVSIFIFCNVLSIYYYSIVFVLMCILKFFGIVFGLYHQISDISGGTCGHIFSIVLGVYSHIFCNVFGIHSQISGVA